MLNRLTGSKRPRSGFTLIELLVVVAIIALLISILLPSLSRARELARRTACAANMGALGRAATIYAEGNRGVMPTPNHVQNISFSAWAQGTWVGRYIMSKDMYGDYDVPASSNYQTPPETDEQNFNPLSNTRGWFKLLQGGESAYLQPKQFICHSARTTVSHLPNGTQAERLDGDGIEWRMYDFDGAHTDSGAETTTSGDTELLEFSYSFHMNLRYASTSGTFANDTLGVPDGEVVGITLNLNQNPGKPMAADRNPYSNHTEIITSQNRRGLTFPEGTGETWGPEKTPESTGASAYLYNASKTTQQNLGFPIAPSIDAGSTDVTNDVEYTAQTNPEFPGSKHDKTANSRNHKQEGQNVVFLDGHAKWFKTAKAGVDGESIWTTWAPDGNGGFISGGDQDVQCGEDIPCDHSPPGTDLSIASAPYGTMRARSTWLTDTVLIP